MSDKTSKASNGFTYHGQFPYPYEPLAIIEARFDGRPGLLRVVSMANDHMSKDVCM